MGADRCQKIEEALQAFALDGAVKAYERYGSGHINDTFRVTCEKDEKEIREYKVEQLKFKPRRRKGKGEQAEDHELKKLEALEKKEGKSKLNE